MKKLDAFICGIASIFACSDAVPSDVFKKYPSTYEKNAQKSLQNSWYSVGKSLKGAVNKYGSKAESNS